MTDQVRSALSCPVDHRHRRGDWYEPPRLLSYLSTGDPLSAGAAQAVRLGVALTNPCPSE
jgi:hypothetical protein